MVTGFIADSKRVLEISYKPDQTTFKRTLKIVLIGTLILGIMGFIISTIITFLT
jgi:protein translocase SEC61 complex gamma subunit